MEQWNSLVGYEGLYEGSSEGRIRSLKSGVILKPRDHPSGYYQVRLYLDREPTDYFIHSLICKAFHGPRPNGMEAAHADGVKANCRASNLSWKTALGNAADKRLHGTVVRGDRHGRSRLTSTQATEIMMAQGTQRQIADRFGVSQSQVHRIRSGQRWQHLRAAA